MTPQPTEMPRPLADPLVRLTAVLALSLGSVVGAAELPPRAVGPTMTLSSDGAITLSPDVAVQWALLRNPTLLIAKEQVNVGQAELDAEAAAWQSELFATVEGSESKQKNSLERDDKPVLEEEDLTTELGVRMRTGSGAEITLSYDVADRMTNSETGNDPEGFDDLVTTLNVELRQPLLRGQGATAIKGRIAQAEQRLEIARQDLQRRLLETSYQTVSTYWQLYRAQQIEALSDESLVNAGALLEDTRRLVAAGRLAPAAVDDAQSGLLLRRAELSQAAQASRRWESELRAMLALDPSKRSATPIQASLDPDLSPMTEPANFGAYVGQVLAIWPNYHIAVKQIAIQETALEMVKDDSRSTLDLVLSYGQNARSFDSDFGEAFQDSFGSEYPEWRVAFEWTRTFGENRLGKAQQEKSESLIRQAKLEAEAVKTEVANQLNIRLGQVQSTFNEVAEHRQNLVVLGQLLSRERLAFQQGESSVRVVIAREDAYNAARVRTIEAEVRYELAKTALRLSDGTLLEQLGIALDALDAS